ncbi:MAG TPA: FkbM family methyltransferase, partial [Vicinamibacteria bacterium]|nr:FkbM family methyltransferase [Vicinamibacteria bacterium]
PPPSPAATASAPASILDGRPLYSQHKEELIARDFFRDRRDGVFLDVGCASPIQDSNTYYLEKHLGWSGLAVDALPEFAQAWERKRPRSRFFNFYVSDHADTVEPFYRSVLRGTSSGRKDQKGPGGKEVPLEEIQVPTTTLNKLLDTNGVTRIDYLSMDIEGHEPAALKGFDLQRFRPALACVEAKPANRDFIKRYFAERGYAQLERYLPHDPVNYYFAPAASGG